MQDRQTHNEADADMSANKKKEFEEPMDVSVGAAFTVVTGGAEGTDALAEACARQWGMQVEQKNNPGTSSRDQGDARTGKTVERGGCLLARRRLPFETASLRYHVHVESP